MTLLLDELQRIHEASPADTKGAGDRRTPQNRTWWVVCARERQHQALASKLSQWRIPFYLPLAPCTSDAATLGHSYVPLFGNLLFAFGSEEECRTVLATRMVSRILPVDDEDRLRQSLLDLHRLLDSGYALTMESPLPAGTKVRVAGGELKGLQGVLIERSGNERLLVAIDEIGQGVSISVDLLPKSCSSLASL